MLLKVSVRREGKIEKETTGDPASVPRPGTSSSTYKKGEHSPGGNLLLGNELEIISEVMITQ